jgi:curli biogenesis system outer membrane secretion channel CsgG
MVAMTHPLPPLLFVLALVSLLGGCAPQATVGADVRGYTLPGLPGVERYVVAVYDFEADPTRFDAGLLPNRERDERLYIDLGAGIADVITRELFELERFDLVERRNLAAAILEQDLGRSGRFDASTVAEVGRLVGAELILVGAISELSIDRSSAVVPGFLGGTVITTVTVSVDLRFVEVATGRIVAIGSGSAIGIDAEVSIAALQQSLRLLRVGTVRQSMVASALRNAIREAVEEAAQRLPPKRP